MATTIHLPDNTMYLTSEFPDVRISTSLDEINVTITCDGQEIFAQVFYPFDCILTLYELSSILEEALIAAEMPYAHFKLEAFGETKSDNYASIDFDALYCSISLLGLYTNDYLAEYFLTLPTFKRVDVRTSDTLHFFAKSGEELSREYIISYSDHRGRQYIESSYIHQPNATHDGIVTFTIDFADLYETFSEGSENPISFLSLTAKVGKRYFTYFFTNQTPTYTFHFRNCFGLWEKTSFLAKTTVKPKVDRSVAVSRRRSSFYDQTVEKSYETETYPLTPEEAEWLQIFLIANETKIQITHPGQHVQSVTPDLLPDIIVTESTGEATDDDNELCKVKFTWRFASPYPHVAIPNTDRIHTDPFLETFN